MKRLLGLVFLAAVFWPAALFAQKAARDVDMPPRPVFLSFGDRPPAALCLRKTAAPRGYRENGRRRTFGMLRHSGALAKGAY